MQRGELLRPAGRGNGAKFSRPLPSTSASAPPAANCCIKAVNHCRKAAGSSIPSSREKVSWPGMPFSSFRKEGLQEFPFGVAEKFQIGAGLAAAKHSAKGDHQDVMSWREWRRTLLARGSSRAPNRLANSVIAASPLLHFASLHATRRWPLSYRTPQNAYAIALALRPVRLTLAGGGC